MNLRMAVCASFLMIAGIPAHAQWVPTNGPYSGNVDCFAVMGINSLAPVLFAGNNSEVASGVFRSTDNGKTWSYPELGANVRSLAVMGTNLFAGTEYGVDLSTDSGASWKEVDSLLPSTPFNAFAVLGTTIYAGTGLAYPPTGHGVFCSTDTGKSWTSDGNGLPANSSVISLQATGTILVAGLAWLDSAGLGSGGVFRSTDRGASWTNVTSGWPFNAPATSFALSGNDLFAATQTDGDFLSTDSGRSWTSIGNGGACFAAIGPNLFAGGFGSVVRSTNNGISWTASGSGLPQASVQALVAIGTNAPEPILFAGTNDSGVFISTDEGASWNATGLTSMDVRALATIGENSPSQAIVAGSPFSGIFLSSDSGESWARAGGTTTWPYAGDAATCFAVSGTNLFAGSQDGVARTTDGGAHWTAPDKRFQGDTGARSGTVTAYAVIGPGTASPILFAGTDDIGVYRSTDNGANWIDVNNGLSYFIEWTTVKALAVIGTNTSSSTLFAGLQDRGIYLSTDSGNSWQESGLNENTVQAFAVMNSNSSSPMIFAGTADSGVFLSTDRGSRWKHVGLTHQDVRALAVCNGNSPSPMLFAGTYGNGIFFSPDHGTTWISIEDGLINPYVQALTVTGGNTSSPMLFAATNGSSVWRRSLSELSTVSYSIGVSADSLDFGSVPVGKDSVRIVTVSNVGKSPLTIQSFQLTPKQNAFSTSDLSAKVELLPGESFTFEVFFQPSKAGVFSANLEIVSEAESVNITFTGSAYAAAEITPQSDPTSLLTIFPNPFSQSTTISFTSQASGYAYISIVNALGTEIAHLYSGELAAGEHRFVWNPARSMSDHAAAPRVPDGMYECLVRMNGRMETVPIMLDR